MTAEQLQDLFDRTLAVHQSGRTAEAEASYLEILVILPQHAGALHLLGVIRQQQGRYEEALELIGQAIAVNPAKPVYHNNYGTALLSLNRFAEAEASFRRALEIRRDYADAWDNLGLALASLCQEEAALESFKMALQIEPRRIDALKRSTAMLKKLGRGSEAVALYERAISQSTSDELPAGIHLDFAKLLLALKQHDDAIEQFQTALKKAPSMAHAHFGLGNALKDQGKIEQASVHLRQAVELRPRSPRMHTNLLLCQQYQPNVTPAELAAAHAEWHSRHAAPWRKARQPFENDRRADRTLRLGFVSRNFRNHPVGYLTIRAIEGLKAHECEVVCYSDTPEQDSMTERYMAAADCWLNTADMSDDALAEKIRSDRIDILFDLGGHLGGNRLLVFARKPAPIQVRWIGYAGSTGLTAMDYLLADRYHVEPADEIYQPEKVLRLPDGYACFDPPAGAPEVGPLPAIENGHVTFGSFNNPAKVTPVVVATWAEILRRVPNARLLLRFAGFEQRGTRQWYEGLFSAQGIGPERIEFLGRTSRTQILADYNRVDLALDTFPYSGGVTTCEALWMGVPVITYPGKTFAGRHSLSHLSNIGLTETIAPDVPGYIELAIELANDLPRLAKWRAELRHQMAQSPLCDGPRFAANLMASLRSIWQGWIANAISTKK